MSADPTATRFTGVGRRRLTAWLTIPLIALLIMVVGGYAAHWEWTGFQKETLWDWLNIVLIPITLAVLPLWLSSRRRDHVIWRLGFAFLLAAFVTVLIGGYVGHWAWTGFAGNTLFDWIRLLLVPFALPLVVLAILSGFAVGPREGEPPRAAARQAVGQDGDR